MIAYLLKCSACIALFYLVYAILFRHTNLFQLNRAYLLTGLILSFAVPLIVVPIDPVNLSPTLIQDGQVAMDSHIAGTSMSIASSLPFISYLYFSGVGISFLITIVSVLRTIKLYRSGHRLVRDNRTIIVDQRIQPFSFFGVMFISSVDEDPIVTAHEMVHMRQGHWIDLLIIELAAIVVWFNPVMSFYRKSIALQHEYIADREVTSNVSIKSYLDCITKQLESRVLASMTNSFNAQSIKQRIMMLTNTRSYSAFRYAVILPIVAMLVMAFATRKQIEDVGDQNRELRSPVDVSKLKPGEGAGFGKRFDPATNKEQFHTGVDFVLAAGNSVYATAGGVVVTAANSGDYGNLIVIEHNKKLTTSSAHLERILVKVGEKVETGQLIGLVGSTGLSTGPHLHFEVKENGKAVDPVPYLNMSVD